MLIRLITVISLFKFMLLLIAGSNPDVALYRSLIVFMILFTVVYLGIFFLNIIQNNSNIEESTVPGMKENKSKTKEEG
ncbi:hypothetical protein DYD21_01560 [Rhodohalobacter sp. SW132]|uniref:hypothetical protein n=1 Tax=Rhodohalobacter sp. SW132 TaxID=2293433 RepID=UPI000E378D3F|nr:hypothetical protein [Rhodohalobacter sp. SW132]REL38663.1 hypothetical protein DYD21_01560 [Rhodohalobacter sp. SW132]